MQVVLQPFAAHPMPSEGMSRLAVDDKTAKVMAMKTAHKVNIWGSC